jgi:hypothetical protein
MKTIFLDIDGVIATDKTYREAGRKFNADQRYLKERLMSLFDPDKINLLNEITDATGAQFILSSTWREFNADCGTTCIQMLREAGLKGEFIDQTRRSCAELGFSRGLEIADCIIRLGLSKEDIIILDDDLATADLGRKLPGWGCRWIQTPTTRGMNQKHAKKAIQLLTT